MNRERDRRRPGKEAVRPPAQGSVRPSLSVAVIGLSMLVIAGAVLVGGTRGVIAAVLALVAVPVAGFTYDQIALTRRGRSLATTVEEIRALKSSDELAFTRPLTTIFRGSRGEATHGTAKNVQHMPGRWEPSATNMLVRDTTEVDLLIPNTAGACVSGAGGGAPDTRHGMAFWQALTEEERRALQGRAREASYRPGDVLCREGLPAEHVIVILSGWAKVWVHEPDGVRDIAFRGPGDLVGERAALLVRARSAMVTAETDVSAYQTRTESFLDFLAEHPRVQAVLERQVYDRLTEVPPRPAGWGRPQVPAWSGGNCSILFTDIAGFGGHVRDDDDRMIVRNSMYEMLQDAFAGSGLGHADYYQEDRGDGALIIVPPDTPTRSVVDPMLARLEAGLRRHNRRASEATRLQLRVALHVGPVTWDPRGVSGTAIIQTARLLEAPVLKSRLAETVADLGFIASAFVYEAVIQQGPGFVDPACYLPVEIQVKESALTAWMYLAGGSSLRAV
ncbi:cyclic nucleotide-binding domain-containing protein [Spirillospora sp. NPDC048911]|uniref:cyclic nucleotide-binding domain-containing protein n=1 Tax=Spirillospora sp. NPDC048911 TaxID=3364527 RepID=UPI0037198E92